MRAAHHRAPTAPRQPTGNVLTEPVPIPSLHDAESQRLAGRLAAIAQAMAACDGVDEFPDSGWLPDRFFVLIDELYETYDAYIAHNLSASSLKIQCRAGCSRCCRQAVHGVYAFEIVNLYRRLRSAEDYAAVHEAFSDYAEQFQATVSQISETEGDGVDAVAGAVDAFAAAALPCPLLRDNRCRVYAHRPAPCRMYHSLTNPIHCTTPQGETFDIEMPPPTSEILWSLSDRLAYPISTFLAQGMVTFGNGRDLRPWSEPST